MAEAPPTLEFFRFEFTTEKKKLQWKMQFGASLFIEGMTSFLLVTLFLPSSAKPMPQPNLAELKLYTQFHPRIHLPRPRQEDSKLQLSQAFSYS